MRDLSTTGDSYDRWMKRERASGREVIALSLSHLYYLFSQLNITANYSIYRSCCFCCCSISPCFCVLASLSNVLLSIALSPSISFALSFYVSISFSPLSLSSSLFSCICLSRSVSLSFIFLQLLTSAAVTGCPWGTLVTSERGKCC